MKHTNEICKKCGSRQKGLVYDRGLLDEEDINRIRICPICKSEYFIFEIPLDNRTEEEIVEMKFIQCYEKYDLTEKQALMIAKRLFVINLKP